MGIARVGSNPAAVGLYFFCVRLVWSSNREGQVNLFQGGMFNNRLSVRAMQEPCIDALAEWLRRSPAK